MQLRSSSVVPGALALAAVFLASPLAAQWTSVHRDGTNNRLAPTTAAPDDLTVPADTETDQTDLMTGSGPVLSTALAYAVARTSSPDRVYIRAFAKNTLDLVWTSPDLDASSDTFSLSSPTYVPAVDALYLGTGSTVSCIRGGNGTVAWSTQLTPANTNVGSKYTITNGSPTIGLTNAYIHTYGGFSGPYLTTQVVALDLLTGAVDWAKIAGGIGTSSPVFYDDPDGGDPDLVIASTSNASNQGGMKAFDAATGDLIWDSETVAVPWSTTSLIWAEAVLDSGKLYAVTYNFSGTGGQLICVDAATGALEWSAPSLTADSPPVLYGGELYLLGGSFFAPMLARHSTISGGLLADTFISGTVFRNHMAVTADGSAYLSMAGEGTRRFTLPTMTLASTTTDLTYDGPTAIDANGDLYLKSGGVMRTFGDGLTATIFLGQSSPTSAELLDFYIVFSEDVGTSFNGADIGVAGTYTGGHILTAPTGSGAAYTATIRLVDANLDGTVGLVIGDDVVSTISGKRYSGGVSPLYTIANGGVLFAREDYNRDGVVNVGDVTDLGNNVTNGVSLPQ